MKLRSAATNIEPAQFYRYVLSILFFNGVSILGVPAGDSVEQIELLKVIYFVKLVI